MLSPLVAAIPYKTMPTIELGPLTLRTFGLMVAVGVVLGAWFGAVHSEQYGLARDDAYRLGTRMVLAGVVGARLAWVLTNLDQIDSPLDVIAVWEGGLQFSGGFLAAIAIGLPTFMRWNRLQRWQLIDGFAVATVLGAAFGRIGCLSVGEHFGRETSFPLATRFEGSFGDVAAVDQVREGTLGPDGPAVVPGLTFHNPSLYECVTLFVMFVALWAILRRRPTPGTTAGIFFLVYAVSRFSFDALRVNDERIGGLTGAQWMCVALVPTGIYVLTRVRPDLARRLAAGEVGGTPVTETTSAVSASGQSVSTTKRRPSRAARVAASVPSAAAAAAAATETEVEGSVALGTADDSGTNQPEPPAPDAGAGRLSPPPLRQADDRDQPDSSSDP